MGNINETLYSLKEGGNPSILGASRIVIKLDNRDIFQYKGNISDYHLFFEDIVPGTFPILLLGNWERKKINKNNIGNIVLEESDFEIYTTIENIAQENPDRCILVIYDGVGKYDILLFRKKSDEELPLVASESTHSTAMMRWEQVGETIELIDNTKITQENTRNNISHISPNIIP